MSAGGAPERGEAPRRRVSLARILVGTAITAALVGFVVANLEWSRLVARFRALSATLAVVGLLVYGLIYAVRAWRFMLFAPRTPFGTMLAVTAVHTLLLRVLPLRTGEFGYGALLRRAGTAGFGESMLSLVLLRGLDAAVVAFIFGVTLVLNRGIYRGDAARWIAAAAVLTVAAGAAVAAFHPMVRLSARLVRALSDRLARGRYPRIVRLVGRVEAVAASFTRIPRRVVVEATLVSLLLWALNFVLVYLLIRAFGVRPTVAQAVLGGTAAVVSGFLPLSVVGNVGSLEAGWSLGFMLVGFSRPVAVDTAVGFSVTTFAYAVIFGAAGWAFLVRASGRREATG